MEQIASLDKLQQCLNRIRKSNDYLYLQDLITELHFAYEVYRFKGTIPEPKDLQTLVNVAYYLIGAFTNPVRVKSIEPSMIEDGLSISALVFELLGRYAQISVQVEARDEFNLNAAIAYSLSRYQANSAVLAKSLFVDKLTTDDYSVAQIGKNCIFALLGRKYFWLQKNSAQLLNLVNFDTKIDSVESGDFSPMGVENIFWALIVSAAVLLSRYLIQGDEKQALESISILEKAKVLAGQYDLLEEHWLAARLLDCENKTIERSTWKVLRKHNFSEQYISTLTRFPQNAVHELWDSQLEALQKVDFDGSGKEVSLFSNQVSRALVSMPTSAGKTLIAELAIIKILEGNKGAKCVYVAPSRALVDEIEEKLHRRFRFLGYKVANMVGAFEMSEWERKAIELDSVDVAILTPEKLDYLFHKREPFTNHIKLIIFDEAHKIGDTGGRGWLLETLIAWLLLKPSLSQAKFIFMSAVLPYTQRTDLRLWVGRGIQASLLFSEWSPSRQLISILSYQDSVNWKAPVKTETKIKRDKVTRVTTTTYNVEQTASIQIKYKIGNIRRNIPNVYNKRFFLLVSDNGTKKEGHETWYDRSMHAVELLSIDKTPPDSTLVYFQQKRDLMSFCKKAPAFFTPINDPNIDKLIDYITKRLGKSFPLNDSLPYGIAFHHGDLPQDVRNEIENAYKNKTIRVLACTTTLAEGVNLAVKTFILGYPKTQGGHRLGIRDFKNIIGRAGRALIDTEGTVIAIRHPDFRQDDNDYFDSLIAMDNDNLLLKSSVELIDTDEKTISNELELLSQALLDEQIDTQAQMDDSIEKLLMRLQVIIFSFYEDTLLIETTAESVKEVLSSTFLFSRSGSSEKIKENIAKAGLNFLNTCSKLDPNRLRIFNSSGLSFSSNLFLETLSKRIYERTKDFSFRDLSIAKAIEAQDIIDIYANISEAKPKQSEFSSKFEIINTLDHYAILMDWINGTDFDVLRDKYFKKAKDISSRTTLCQSYISKQFIYKLPWVFASIHTHLEAYEATLLIKTWFDTLPAQIKYGVDTPEAVYFSANGIHSRFLARRLSELYRKQNEDVNPENFEAEIESWFLSLSPFALREQAADLPELAIRQAIKRINAIRKPTRNIQNEGRVYFNIAGWQHSQGETIIGELLDLLAEPEKPTLQLEHDLDNEYDEYAVAIYFGRTKLGYVPRASNEEIAYFLALGTPLTVKLNTIGARSQTGYRNVEILVTLA